MKLRAWFVLASILVLAFTCGDRRPVIVNDLSRPISVRSTWEDGSVVEDKVPASGQFFLSDPPHHPSQVTISVPGGKTQTFTKENAPGLLSVRITGPIIGWRVTESGVVPLNEKEFTER